MLVGRYQVVLHCQIQSNDSVVTRSRCDIQMSFSKSQVGSAWSACHTMLAFYLILLPPLDACVAVPANNYNPNAYPRETQQKHP